MNPKLNNKKSTPSHSVAKLQVTKDEETVLKAAKEKRLFVYKRIAIILSANVSFAI